MEPRAVFQYNRDRALRHDYAANLVYAGYSLMIISEANAYQYDTIASETL